MDQIVDAVPGLPTLDGPVPLMVEQLVDVLQLFDALIPVAEQCYQRAQDLHRAHPAANLGSRAAAGGTAGGSTDDRVIFLVRRVVGDTQIFKVFSEDRVQQVSSRSLIFLVEVFIAQVRVHLLQMGLVKGFFALFPVLNLCEVGFAFGVGTAHRVELIHAGCSVGGLRRVGAAQG